MVLFIMLYKVVVNCEPVDEILTCDHSNERYPAALSIILYKVIYIKPVESVFRAL